MSTPPAPRTSYGPDLYTVAAGDLAGILRLHARAVAVVTAGTTRQPVGFVATSLAPVSVRPPVLSFALSRRSRSWRVVGRSRHVLIHLLAADQADVAATFAGSSDKFDQRTAWHRGPFGLPEIDDVLACLAMEIDHTFQLGDHAIVVGHPVAGHPVAGSGGSGRPALLHVEGAYCGLPMMGSNATTVVP